MANEQQFSQEEMEKQRQNQMMMQARMQKIYKYQQMGTIISSTDPSTILSTLASRQGITLFCHPAIAIRLLSAIYTDVMKGVDDADTLKIIGNALNQAINCTNNHKMQFGNPMMGMMGMNPMMMGMGMPGMGMNMNPMMGVGMMPGMGMDMSGMGMMGMNPMMGMGMYGMNNFGMSNNKDAKSDTDNVANIKEFIERNLKPTSFDYAVDPLIFLQILSTSGIDIDFSENKEFEQLCRMAIYNAIASMSDFQFNATYCILSWLYTSNYQKQWMENQKKNGNNTANNMNYGMNPMMGMNNMPGMGMDMSGMNMGVGMMPGMGMDMSGMNMGVGMMPGMGMDMSGMNMGMGMMGMNPMMNGMGMGMNMNPMMGGMNMTMPGMGAVPQSSNGSIF